MRPFRPTPPPGGSRGMTPLCRNMGTGGVWQRPLAAGGWRFGTGGKRRQKTLRGRGKNRRGLWATRVHGGQGKQEAREASQAREDSQSPVRDSVEERDPCCLPGRGQYFPFKHNASARGGFVMPVNDTMPGALILRRRILYSENKSKQASKQARARARQEERLSCGKDRVPGDERGAVPLEERACPGSARFPLFSVKIHGHPWSTHLYSENKSCAERYQFSGTRK